MCHCDRAKALVKYRYTKNKKCHENSQHNEVAVVALNNYNLNNSAYSQPRNKGITKQSVNGVGELQYQ